MRTRRARRIRPICHTGGLWSLHSRQWRKVLARMVMKRVRHGEERRLPDAAGRFWGTIGKNAQKN